MGHQLACICEQCSNPLSYPRTHHQATGVCFTLLICVPINMYDIYVIIYTHYIYIYTPYSVYIYIYMYALYLYIYTRNTLYEILVLGFIAICYIRCHPFKAGWTDHDPENISEFSTVSRVEVHMIINSFPHVYLISTPLKQTTYSYMVVSWNRGTPNHPF